MNIWAVVAIDGRSIPHFYLINKYPITNFYKILHFANIRMTHETQ